MDVHDLLNELKECDQSFSLWVMTSSGPKPLTELEPAIVNTDDGQDFAYLLHADTPTPVATDEMRSWLEAKGHPL